MTYDEPGTYNAARQKLPADATFAKSEGNPNCGGYREIFYIPRGATYIITISRSGKPIWEVTVSHEKLVFLPDLED